MEQRNAPVREPADNRVIHESRNEESLPLFDDSDFAAFRTRWDGIQTGFVDEPRAAVEQADALVAEIMHRLTNGFDDQRRRLEGQWDRNEQVSTEDLRVALKRYRSFFERLLSLEGTGERR